MRILLLALLAACGRIGFDGAPDGGDAVYFSMDDYGGGLVPSTHPDIRGLCLGVECPASIERGAGAALQFDGVDDYVLIDRPDLVAASYTVVFLLQLGGIGASSTPISQPRSASSAADAFAAFLETGDEIIFETSAGDEHVYLPGPVLAPGAWHHIALSFDGTAKRLYVDGTLARMMPATVDRSDVGIILGADVDPPPAGRHLFFGGGLDELRFYARALDAAEIADLP